MIDDKTGSEIGSGQPSRCGRGRRRRLHTSCMFLVVSPPSPHSMGTTEEAMATFEVISLMGRSGRSYPFRVYQIGAPIAAVGAVYAVLRDGPVESVWTRRSVLGMGHPASPSQPQWTVLYIGQTDDLRTRFDNANLDLELARIRATHLAIAGDDAESQRREIESDLVPRYALLMARPPRLQRKRLVESITIAQGSA